MKYSEAIRAGCGEVFADCDGCLDLGGEKGSIEWFSRCFLWILRMRILVADD